MFKFLKRINKVSGVPEIVKFPTNSDELYVKEHLYYLRGGSLRSSAGNEGHSRKVICLENAAAGTKSEILGFYVYDDMVFETELDGPSENVDIGDFIGLSQDMETLAVNGGAAALGNELRLLEKKNGHIIVTMVCD